MTIEKITTHWVHSCSLSFFSHNKPRSHYQLIYTISLPERCQLSCFFKVTLNWSVTNLRFTPSVSHQLDQYHQQDQINVPTTTAFCQSTAREAEGLTKRQMSQVEARVTDGSECAGLEAAGDNRGEGTQVTPAEWKAFNVNSTSEFKVFQCISIDTKHTVFQHAPAATIWSLTT